MDTSKYLFHGTSSLYIPYILKDGLNGRYPDELYSDLQFFWDKVPKTNKENSDKISYINGFLERQLSVRNDNTISISLTSDYDVAKEYANVSRNNGEGPGYIMDLIHNNKDDIKTQLSQKDEFHLDELFTKFGFSPHKQTTGIILAFKINELSSNISNEDLRGELTKRLKNSEVHYKLYTFAIPLSIINIVIPKGKGSEPSKIVNITGEEAESYIRTLGSEPTIGLLEKGPEEDKIIVNIINYLESNPTTGSEFVLPNITYLSAFKLTPEDDKNEFIECSSFNYPNFTFFYKKNIETSSVNLKIIPKISGGKKLKSRLYIKYSKRKYSKRKYSKRKYSKRKYSKRNTLRK